ncbi:Ldh family oxidoreductase [Kiloniella sp.]|uniref:Ldh family oxidoreductase n=1 Tax=Kiloniella sp. TaxID=1938587 RepID=UPI003B014BEA
MVETVTMSVSEIEDLALKALLAAGTNEKNAASLARSVAVTESDGIASHGLAYVPTYCLHVECGKVDGNAVPALDVVRPGLAIADAKTGFAHTAIDLGFDWLVTTAREQGIAALGLRNSYNCGILGYHTDRLASHGLLGIGFTNAPASVAPVGGKKAVLGTNPFSVAVPGANGETRILIDQSASVIAKSEVMKHAREGKAIPEGWALGPDGQPTTDPDVALKGTMIPSGSYKGFGSALMVELMAAALTGATLGIHSSPFSGPVGGPPKTGQFFMAIDPEISSGGAFTGKVDHLIEAIVGQEGTHLHGSERYAAREKAAVDGVAVNAAVVDKVNEWASKI